MAQVGPLLAAALEGEAVAAAADGDAEVFALNHVRETTDQGEFPVVITARHEPPLPGERWSQYRERTINRLGEFDELLVQAGVVAYTPLVAANAFQLTASAGQIRHIADASPQLEVIELDPLVQVTTMDDVRGDIDVDQMRQNHPNLDGRDVRVAVLDSGIDLDHPCLAVAASVATCDEPVELPGSHGTHCAGSIASRDGVFGGVAPAATLINVKVLRSDGTGRNTYISAGVDAALDHGASVLSMSLGFNHLPTWSNGGHGWACADGRCPLCTAVNNAVSLDHVVVVVAAGNEHERGEALRSMGGAAAQSFDTELGCPGQAQMAITVGAVTKNTFLAAPFSSRGPSAYGAAKPDIVAPGVNITSTVPIPRDANGAPVSAPDRSLQFGRKSGTSMATPIVAGAVALVIQRQMEQAGKWTPDSVRTTLLTGLVEPIDGDASVIGNGRLVLANL